MSSARTMLATSVTRYRPFVPKPSWRAWLLSASVQDAVIAVALVVLAEVEAAGGQVAGPRAASLPLGLLMTAPLAVRRRSPLLVLTVVLVSMAVQSEVGVRLDNGSLASVLAILLSVYTVAHQLPLQPALAGGGFAYAVVAATVLHGAGSFAWAFVLVGSAWGAGRALRTRRAQAEAAVERAGRLEREQDALAARAVADERARIARELHDVVTHSVSVMVVQAGAAQQVLPAGGEEAGEALQAIQTTGRQALVELRRLLGVLRTEAVAPRLGPQPGLAALDQLAESMRQAGTPVAVHVDGASALPAGLDLAAFRIVQEALTNVLKHAPGASTEVRIGYRPTVLELEIANTTIETNGGVRLGHGLIGMRERARLYGGALEAGPDGAGRFVVRARLPLDAAT